MVTRSADPAEDGVLMLIVNAARKEVDFAHLEAALAPNIRLARAPHRALLALQGPKAAEVLARHSDPSAALGFMAAASMKVAGLDCHGSRSGYTGEDGFEISIRADRVERLARTLLAEPEVWPIGLGARDSLRLEAGLCLYGHDIDETTSPVEAGLVWSIGPARKRVGLLPEGRAPAREGTEITDGEGRKIGVVTSGGFGPTLNGPLAMGYVDPAHAAVGVSVMLVVRGKPLPATVAPMPFVPNRYRR